VSVFRLWREIVLGVTYLPYQLCHCVFFLVVAGNSFGLHRSVFLVVAGNSFRCYLLTYHTSCAVVSVFWLRREIVFGCTVSKKDSYPVSLIESESASKCVYFLRPNTLLLCISLLCIYLLFRTDPQTHRLDSFPELSGQVGISRIPSKTLIEKLPIFLVNTLLLIWFHKHSFTPYPSLSGQVGISSIPSKNADRKMTNLSGKHSFTLSFS
jgi:hypothetical protein